MDVHYSQLVFICFNNFKGLKDITAEVQRTPLSEFGMNSMMAVKIKQTLEREFDISLTAQDIHKLNFAKLTTMCGNKYTEQEKTQIEQKTIDIPGIQLLIQTINDKDMISEIYVDLSTRKDPRRINAFILPGIKSCVTIFKSLASKIKPISTILQYGTNNIGLTYTSIPEYADFFLPVCIKKHKK